MCVPFRAFVCACVCAFLLFVCLFLCFGVVLRVCVFLLRCACSCVRGNPRPHLRTFVQVRFCVFVCVPLPCACSCGRGTPTPHLRTFVQVR